jgi:GNAT superfamily N-acetyltransferase
MLNMPVFERMPRPGDVASGRPTRWGYVANVYVDAAHRDRGLGRLLLDAAASYAEREQFAVRPDRAEPLGAVRAVLHAGGFRARHEPAGQAAGMTEAKRVTNDPDCPDLASFVTRW